jgi:hypothetical protein
VCPKAVKDECPGSSICTIISLGVRYTLGILQADIRIVVTRLTTRIMPCRSGEGITIAPVNSSRSVNHTYDHTYEDSYRAKHAEYHLSVVHFINYPRYDGWVAQYSLSHLEPACHLSGEVRLVAVSV